jgi:hypothetical protein
MKIISQDRSGSVKVRGKEQVYWKRSEGKFDVCADVKRFFGRMTVTAYLGTYNSMEDAMWVIDEVKQFLKMGCTRYQMPQVDDLQAISDPEGYE